MNRRDLLKGAAVAPLAMLPISSVIAADRSDWNKATVELQKADLALALASQAHSEAEEAAEHACPHIGCKHLNRYGLSCVATRKANLRNAHFAVVTEWVGERGRVLTFSGNAADGGEARLAKLEAERIVDEFEAWQRNTEAADRRFRTDELEAVYEAALERREAARARVFALPAPDHPALLFKIELLDSSLDEMDDHDATSMAAIVADARRLLSHGRA